MKITADNRGRIALSKLDAPFARKGGGRIGNPDQEWEVTYEGNIVTLTPAGEEPKEEWSRYYHLSPEDIGTVIGVYSRTGGAAYVPESSRKEGLFGVLEGYSYADGRNIDLKLRGVDHPIDLDTSSGFQYFWKRN